MELAYENEVVEGHQFFPDCGSTLRGAAEEDYPGKGYFREGVKCLAMDEYERKISKGRDRNPTMDVAVGIVDYENNRCSHKRLLLVEFRMNYGSERTLDASEWIKKDEHTKALLYGTCTVENCSCFIFNDKVIERVTHWFRDKKGEHRKLKNYKVFSVSQFDGYIKLKEDYPYTPQESVVRILRELKQSLSSGDVFKYTKQVAYWADKARGYGVNYMKEEADGIKKAVRESWNQFKQKALPLTGEEKLEVEIVEEDFAWLTDV
ncbi:MAG: hypothetical protein NC048_03420 [Bacteroides sp.]|nr:hypothetical protein [Ruminococcus flavefaciens]MCM1554525.1 hypothetical protein [Bacteroides sp.]